MNRINLRRITLALLQLACAGLFCAAQALAAPEPLSEQELAEVGGQGLVIFNNSSYAGLDFSTIAMNADVTLNANFSNIKLGTYAASPNGTGSDIDIAKLQFGRSDGTTANRLVQMSNPYLQFVYDNSGASQVVGLRVGFEGIAGDLGLQANSISGSMLVKGTALTGDLSRSGKRWNNVGCSAPCLALPNVGGVTAGDGSGPSRDFWISILRSPVQFPAAPGMAAAPVMAQAGYWLNWTDRLSALNTTGVAPPNLALGH